MPSVMWFRRDLRLHDNPALLAAAAAAADGRVVPLFVVDPVLFEAQSPRQAYLLDSLRALDADLGGELLVRIGRPGEVVPQVARAVEASSVHVTADHGPYGSTRDERVDRALGDVPLERTGSAYAVSPGRIRKPDGTPYRVFTPFWRAWTAHGWRSPAGGAAAVAWDRAMAGDALPSASATVQLPEAGERAAIARWREFRDAYLPDYARLRDRPDLGRTSRMSHHLHFGEVHPRTLLADLGVGEGPDAFRRELCWREFYADVLHHNPGSASRSLDPRFDHHLRWARGTVADASFAAWSQGRTGYPLVDAGMRQLLTEGWMHNRVRMAVASFLVKDLHIPWQRGAAEFMRLLVDADVASNSQGWQWVAGCGTDAAPFHRIFNPVRQGLAFDPEGDYVRRYVPELRHLEGASAHEPWSAADGLRHGYPERIVDHAAERRVALEDFAALRHASPKSVSDART